MTTFVLTMLMCENGYVINYMFKAAAQQFEAVDLMLLLESAVQCRYCTLISN